MTKWTKEKIIELLEYTLLPSPSTRELRRDSIMDYKMRLASGDTFVGELYHENSKLNTCRAGSIITDKDVIQGIKEWYLSSSNNVKHEGIIEEKAKSVLKNIEDFSTPVREILLELKRDESSAMLLYSVDLLILDDCCVYGYVPMKDYLILEKTLTAVEENGLLSWIISSFPLKGGSVLFVIGAPWRNMVFHGQRGYRQMLLDAGALLNAVQGIGKVKHVDVEVYPLFYDDAINRLLNLDGVENYVLSVIHIPSHGKELSGG